VRTRFDEVDLIIVRENTEDLYAGIEYEEGTAHAEELIGWIEQQRRQAASHRRRHLDQAALHLGTRRIVSSPSTTRAATAAQGHGRAQGEHHEVHDGLYLRVAREVAEENSDIEFDDRSWTTCACSSCSGRRSTTCWCYRTSTATSSPTSPPG
jgi:isocitrate dehydrogenase (NAD+)